MSLPLLVSEMGRQHRALRKLHKCFSTRLFPPTLILGTILSIENKGKFSRIIHGSKKKEEENQDIYQDKQNVNTISSHLDGEGVLRVYQKL